MTPPTILPRDLTDAQVVFGRQPHEMALDAIAILCRARALERDGLDTSGSQAAIIPMLMEKRK